MNGYKTSTFSTNNTVAFHFPAFALLPANSLCSSMMRSTACLSQSRSGICNLCHYNDRAPGSMLTRVWAGCGHAWSFYKPLVISPVWLTRNGGQVTKTIPSVSWRRHQMETFSALLALCVGIHWSPVNSHRKGQWCRALMVSLICAWINDCVNNRNTGDLRRHRAHYDVIVMYIKWQSFVFCIKSVVY